MESHMDLESKSRKKKKKPTGAQKCGIACHCLHKKDPDVLLSFFLGVCQPPGWTLGLRIKA